MKKLFNIKFYFLETYYFSQNKLSLEKDFNTEPKIKNVARTVRWDLAPILKDFCFGKEKEKVAQIINVDICLPFYLFFYLKGTVSRDFLLLVFFMNQFPPSL